MPTLFFLEVERQRTAPFWIHINLRQLEEFDSELSPSNVESIGVPSQGPHTAEEEREEDGEISDDEEEEIVDVGRGDDKRTFDEALMENIALIKNFTAGLEFQLQFRDHRMLETLEKEGASFLKLAKACARKEQRASSTRGPALPTWDRETSSAMWYRTRPSTSQA